MWKLRSLLNCVIHHLGPGPLKENIISRFHGVLPSFCTSAAVLPRKRIEGKVAVITGAASGIGRATAQLFVAEGSKVVIADIQDDLGEQLAKALGSDAHYFHCDVTKEMDVSGVVDFAVAKHGRLDIMFNNAGIAASPGSSITQMDMEEYDKLMDVNLRGVVLGTKYAARAMIPAKEGCIICTASVASVICGLAPHSYTISKQAVVALVKSAASELNAHGIRVNCISPYLIATPMTVSYVEKARRREVTAEMLGEWGDRESGFYGARFKEEDIARVAAFLASEDGRHMSGQNLVVDGAFTTFKELTPLQPSP